MTYVSHKTGSGVGTGLYVIDETLSMTKHPESHAGTYTNRYVHFPATNSSSVPTSSTPTATSRRWKSWWKCGPARPCNT
ncbi:MAG: hypothetical protein R2854_29085 [Caldilineaceae bacterium]